MATAHDIQAPAQPRCEVDPGIPPRLRLYRHHAAANATLAAGIIGGIVAHASGLVPWWAGFLILAAPASALAILSAALADD